MLAGQVTTDNGMRTFNFMVDSLADIVQQSSSFGLLDIDAKLSGHNATEERNLQGVLQNILPVRGSITQTTNQFNNLWMDAMNTDIKGGLLSRLADRALNLLLSLLDHLLNT